MNKREFLKTAGLGLVASRLSLPSFASNDNGKKYLGKWLHRVWITPSPDDKEDDLRKLYKSYQEAGIDVLYIEGDSEKHYRIAKENKLQAHFWVLTFLKDDPKLLASHPEWYSVNRKGESCAQKPAYVPYYRWLCPSRDEVHDYLEAEARTHLAKDYVDGYHLDYVRYCDVILPVNLWSKYGILQNSELPDYDYCYCDVCKTKCKAQHGFDPTELEYPDQSLTWRKYRYDNITRLVNRIAAIVPEYKKPLTAAVFPTPEVARRIVRQDWTHWNLNAVNPMIYHGFYREGVSWIGDAVAEGVYGVQDKFPLYAGLYLPDFKNDGEVKQGIVNAMRNGAAGISFFGKVDNSVLEALQLATNEAMKG